MSRSLMTATEVAELLGVPVSWVYAQSRRGGIPTVTLGRYRRYRVDAIEAWVQELEANGGASADFGDRFAAARKTVAVSAQTLATEGDPASG